MRYTFSVNIIDKLDGPDKPYISAHLADSYGNPIKTRAWLDKKFPENKEVVGELLREVVEKIFPKPAKKKKKKPSSPIKTQRGKSK